MWRDWFARLLLGALLLPNPEMTPGDVMTMDVAAICTPGYAHSVRPDVQTWARLRRSAYLEYGITSHKPGEYEVDHLISLELGGSNDIKNLWPQSYETEPWNAHVKDRLEDRLHWLVCHGELDLSTAQHALSDNWIEAYPEYMGTVK